MFSPRVLGIIAKIMKALKKTYLSPFSWDDEWNTLKISQSKVTPIFTTIFVSHYFPYFVYTVYQLYRAFNDETANFAVMDTFWIALFTLGHYFSFEGVVNPHLKKNEMVTMFEKMTKFEEFLKGKVLTFFKKFGVKQENMNKPGTKKELGM